MKKTAIIGLLMLVLAILEFLIGYNLGVTIEANRHRVVLPAECGDWDGKIWWPSRDGVCYTADKPKP